MGEAPPMAVPPPPPRLHWYSVFQFGLTVFAIFILWSSAAGLLVLGLSEYTRPTGAGGEALATWSTAVTAGFAGLLLLPSALYAFFRLLGRPPSPRLRPWAASWPLALILLFPLVLLLGGVALRYPALTPLVLPLLHLAAIGIPVGWVLYLARFRLQRASSQIEWGVFGSGLVLGPLLIILGEVFFLMLYVMGAAIVVSSQPELMDKIVALAEEFRRGGVDPEEIARSFGPTLFHPLVLLASLSYVALIVPLIEEVFKPIGVWLLVGRPLSPQAGFSLGALSGAGYALFENLALAPTGDTWISIALARVGPAIIHIFTSALVGWALVSAWRERRILRLLFAYLAAVLIHGLWNGLTLVTAFTFLAESEPGLPSYPLLERLGFASPFVLVFLGVGVFLTLLVCNRALRRETVKEFVRP